MKVVCAVLALVIAVSAYDRHVAPYCEAHGNVYTPYPGTRCQYYDQHDGYGPVRAYDLQKTHQCAYGTIFDTRICTCNHADQVYCPEDGYTKGHVDPDYCQVDGNTYTPVYRSYCTSFDQVSADGSSQGRHDCPAGLQFNTYNCVCDYPWNTHCKETYHH